MNSFDNVLQLDESIEYPEGYNRVTVEGTGDERTDKVFSGIEITALPPAIDSGAGSPVSCAIRITDRNAANPFLWLAAFEECQTDNPFEIATTKYIHGVPNVWEEESKINAIPVQAVEGKKIKIVDGFISSYAPTGYGTGLYLRAAWVEYTSGASVSLTTGAAVDENWWQTPHPDPGAAETDDPNDVSGLFYEDLAKSNELQDNEVQVPNITGNEVTVKAYFVPELASEGEATVNVEYDGQTSKTKVTVYRGGPLGYTINLSAEPSSIPPSSEAAVEARVANADGSPVVGESVRFTIVSGPGRVYGGASSALLFQSDIEEEVDSSNDATGLHNTFSLQYPIRAILSIEAPGFSWNRKCKIKDGSTVTLDGQEFPYEVTPLTVHYDSGGYTSCVIQALSSAQVDDEIVVSGAIGGTDSLCRIAIGDLPSSVGTIDISTNPTACAKLGTTAIEVVAYTTTAPATGTVALTVTPEGKASVASVRLGTVPITNEAASIVNRLEVSTEYPIHSVSTVKWNGGTYSVSSFECKTITLTPPGLPVSLGSAIVDYVSGGRGFADFIAADKDYIAYITGTKAFADPETGLMVDTLSTCTVTVGEGVDPGRVNITLTPDPEAVTPGGSSTVTANVTVADEFGTPQPATSGVVLFTYKTTSTGITMSPTTGPIQAGKAVTRVGTNSTSASQVEVTGSYLMVDGSCTVGIKSGGGPPKDDSTHETMIVPIAHIYGILDPKGSISASNLTIQGDASLWIEDQGAAALSDSGGGVSLDPFFGGPLVLKSSIYGYYAGRIVNAQVTGAEINYDMTAKMLPFQRPHWDPLTERYDYTNLHLNLTWDSELNSQLHTEFEIQVVTNYSGSPISGATVTIAGQSATSDLKGVAKFSQLPLGTHSMSITHPNFKDNKAGIAGGSGLYDTDIGNDNYVVVTESTTRPFIVKPMEVDIYISFEVYKDPWY